jgi:SOS-response transcriptional repressor LexA
MQRADMSLRELARRVGYAHGSGVQRHLAQIAETLDLEVALKFAEALQGQGHPPITHREVMMALTGREVSPSDKRRAQTSIPIVGSVQAGHWRPAQQREADEARSVPYVAPPAWRSMPVVAFDLHGHSMDRVYPAGSVLLAVSYNDIGRDPRPGERVIVQRYRHDEVEASCKELRSGPGGLELWPLSTRPEHQDPLPVSKKGEEVRITHRVVGAIVYEPL